MLSFEWSEAVYAGSVSGHCWWFTPYDDGWSGPYGSEAGLAGAAELRAIVAMELALPAVPEWARRVVEGPIRHVAPCGHHRFPLSYLDAVDTIGGGKSPPLVRTCFTVDSQRKERMADYTFCLDSDCRVQEEEDSRMWAGTSVLGSDLVGDRRHAFLWPDFWQSA